MKEDEFNTLTVDQIDSIVRVIRDQDEQQNNQEANRLSLFCNAHMKKKNGGAFTPADFLPEREDAAEKAMDDRMVGLRAAVGNGANEQP
jgi:hypothetical protein